MLTGVDTDKIQNALELLGIVDLRARLIAGFPAASSSGYCWRGRWSTSQNCCCSMSRAVALDPQTRENFYVLLQKLNKDKKITILLVSHDTGTVGKYASKLLYLDKKGNFLRRL